MILVSLTEFRETLEEISALTSYPTTYLSEKTFPDKEILLRAERPDELRGEDVALYLRLYPQQGKRLTELIQALDIISDYSPNKVTLIIPYLIYARQDKRFLGGECITLKALMRVLSTFKVDELITFDVHNPEAIGKYSNVEFRELSALTEVAKYVLKEIFKGEETIVVSPDVGGVKRVKKVAEELGLNYTYLEKTRNKVTGEVRFRDVELNLKGLNALVLDDIISTGGTIARAGEVMVRSGVKRMVAGVTHFLMVGDSAERILNSGYSEIVCSNTIPTPYSRVKVEKLIAEALKR